MTSTTKSYFWVGVWGRSGLKLVVQGINPDEAIRTRKRAKAKRRGMRYILLNSPFTGGHGHHINNDYVINIPSYLHISYQGHNHLKPDTMKRINWVAFQYLMNGMIS